MEYRKLGNAELYVSPVCMGCMGFGDPQKGQHSWTLDELAKRLHARDSHGGATGLPSETPANIQAQAARLVAQLLLGRAMLTAMLARAESRGAHFRADFPKEDQDLNRPNTIRL